MDHPVFGLTSLLDAPSATLPPGIEATYPSIDGKSAADAAPAGLLPTAGRHADPDLTTPLAEYVTARLADAVASAPATTSSGGGR